jgi:hypothetical protein
MALHRAFCILAATLLCSVAAAANPLAVNFTTAEIPLGPGTTDAFPTALPVLLGGNSDIGLPGYVGDTIFLKFRPEDLTDVEAINSLTFSLTFLDNEKDGGETAQIAYALPGSNIILEDLALTKLPIDRQDNPIPLTLTYELSPEQLGLAAPGIFDDGNFRVRIMRESGDFLITGAAATMDVTYAAATATPEPATLLLLLPAMGCICLRRRA